MAATLKVHKWHTWNVCIRLVIRLDVDIYLYPAKYDTFAISLPWHKQLAKLAHEPLLWSLGASFNVKRWASTSYDIIDSQ